MRKLGYLRVSTQEQRPDRQIDGLAEICDELRVEYGSAVARKRPIYEQLLADLEAGDTLVLWDLDRAFRSTVDAVTEAEKLRGRGIDLQIVTLQIDTATPAGMLVYTMMSACAEFERNILSQRTREGLEAARRRGKRLGRPPKLSARDLADARTCLAEGSATTTEIARQLGVAPWSLTRALKRIAAPQDAGEP